MSYVNIGDALTKLKYTIFKYFYFINKQTIQHAEKSIVILFHKSLDSEKDIPRHPNNRKLFENGELTQNLHNTTANHIL